MADGQFRKDLFFRLREVAVKAPALRERREDREMGRDVRGFAPKTLEALTAADWPGNVRELQGAIKQALLASSGIFIELSDIPESSIRRSLTEAAGAPASEAIDFVALIRTALNNGEKGLHEKMRSKLRKLGMSLDKVLAQDAPAGENDEP